jgi:conjugal transfer pilus assembly protein TraB
VNALPDPQGADDLFDPNEGSRKRQRALYLSGAAVLALVGGWYIWAQLGHTPAAKVDETRKRVQATAQIAKGPEAPEVVNADNARRADQLNSQLLDLQNQNLQLKNATNQAEASKNADHADAMRTIQALEDELNRRRGGGASGPAGVSPPSSGPARAFSSPGAGPPPPLMTVPAAAGYRSSGGVTGGAGPDPAERPHRTMSVIRVSAPGKDEGAVMAHPPAAAAPGVTTDYANRGPGAAGLSGGSGGKGGSYISSRLEPFDTANFVPPNSYAEARVLVGVDSATGVNTSSDPKPVLLRVTGDAVSVGSDGRYQRTRLRGCMINGAAYGELPSEKVYVKLQRITCPIGDKKFAVASVEGYVSQRGKAGVRGAIVERSGGLTGRALIAGTLQGLGSTLSTNLSRSVGGVNGSSGAGGLLGTEKLSPSEIAQGAVGGGVSTAASQLAEYYIKRAEQYQPVIEMPTGINVEIVFLSGFQVGGDR